MNLFNGTHTNRPTILQAPVTRTDNEFLGFVWGKPKVFIENRYVNPY